VECLIIPQKNMMKKTLLTMIICLLLTSFVGGVANAQFRLGANGSFQVPLGGLGDVFDMGFGGNISGEFLVGRKANIGLGLNAGYSFFTNPNLPQYFTSYEASIAHVSLMFRTYFNANGVFRPYIGIDPGFYLASVKATALGMPLSDSVREFAFAVILGFQVELSPTLVLDVGAKAPPITLGLDQLNTIGINLGIVYSFGGDQRYYNAHHW